MNPTQTKIKTLTEGYIKFFPAEFESFRTAMKPKRDELRTKFAETSTKETAFIERALTEIPETLFGILFRSLDEDEWKWFDSKRGKEWFGKEFKDFRVGIKI